MTATSMKNSALLLLSMDQLGAHVAAGHDVQWSLRLVAEHNGVDAGALATLALEKHIGVERARAVVEGMKKNDAVLDATPSWKHARRRP